MQHGDKVQEGSVQVFCQQPKVANWITSHVLIVIGGIFLPFSLFDGLIEGEVFLWRDLTVAALMFGLAIPFRILWRNMCSRVEVDTATEKIRFFRFYHEKVVEAPVRSVEFSYTWIFTCFYAGETFTIPGGYINSIAEVLPEGVEIKFPENFWGRLAKRQFEKRSRTIREVGSRDSNDNVDSSG